MKEMYDWVAWHRELAKKIAEGGQDDLVEKIGQVADKQALDPAKLGRDPLSFFGFLRNSQSKSNEVCKTVQDVFGLPELPDPKFRDIIFPSLSNSLSREGTMFPVENDDLLWRLFEQATQATEDNPDIKQEDWKDAMDDGVEVGTLTQALFLVNPDFFLPVDSAVDVCFPEGWQEEKEEKIKGDGGYAEYLSAQEEIKELFPECGPYEIYTFLRWQKDKGVVSKDSKFFQISTNAHGDDRDFWDKGDSSDKYIKDNNFKENNWVFVGGAAPEGKGSWEDVYGLPWEDVKNKVKEKGSRLYPLLAPKRGDIVLVRYGNGNGKGIGVILKNDYDRPDGSGLEEESKIHVLWINKSNNPIAGVTRVRWQAFTHAHSKTYERFAHAEAYKSSFELINQLKEKTTIGSGEQVNQDRQQVRANIMQYPLNTILYGPPGTGKTYHTSYYAVAIIEGESVEVVKNEADEEGGHEEVKNRFDEYRENGQIEMVTFHQNYAYEDFIEGIRPVLDEDGEEDVKYELRKGVFREISDRATKNREKSARVAKNTKKDESRSETWDLDELLQAFATSVQKKLDRKEEVKLSSDDDKRQFVIKYIKWLKDGTVATFRIGDPMSEGWHSVGKVSIKKSYKDYCKGKIKSAEDIPPVRESSEKSTHANAQENFLLFKQMKKFHEEWQPKIHHPIKKAENYVLIIDEINRGNIAKIFGELITLIEESRRLGRTEATEVTLPYSGESFGVPNNLYIIGTMNTADRSIALLDTALRRRFEFKEMMPDPNHQRIETDIGGVNLKELLEKMNDRIRVLLDREHQIGHTYFFGVKDMESLKKAFQNKIIPLLQEYFYDDYEKIALVLNSKDKDGFIEKVSIPSDLIDEDRNVHELSSFDKGLWKNSEQYKNIYMKGEKEQNESGNEK